MVELYKPKSIKEALEILEASACTVFAGGTDLMVKKKQWSGLPPRFLKPVLFISGLKELKSISRDNENITIGAACTLSHLIESSLIPDTYKQVFREMASPSIRNTATIGGNICNASPAGDTLPLLYALGAVLRVESSLRKIDIPIEDFITAPGRTALKEGELLTYIRIPVKEFQLVEYRKVSARRSTALSKLSFIGLAEINDNMLQDIRLAFGAVGPTVIRNRELEREIISAQKEGLASMKAICSYYDRLIKPIDDQRSTAFYRRAVCNRLLIEFLKKALKKCEEKV
jgi:xanthine dehydrogenase FAD-binding subunit